MRKSSIRNLLILGTIGLSSSVMATVKPAKRPNFVWFMEEDVSKHYLSLYNSDGSGAVMPNVEKLAREGVVFNHAFSNAPVSSAARSTLFTGCYAPRTGMSWHRKLKKVPMPDGLDMFPAYLREAGYYTSNSSKTDYNCIMPDNTWDNVKGELDGWRNRPQKDMPFFFVRTNAISHESCLHFPLSDVDNKLTMYDLNKVKIPPIHPDTRLFRYTYATFYDRISDTDVELGKLVQMLSDDNLLDDTFIFYFGDNGGSLPGSKGYTSELGLQVPLVVYIP
ncbi:MAG: sulfatase-like hydrolase/transferase [Parabacteroides sp.]|nr:sulfatase-like hydrolase/transferase [Parabacteroides sp.]